MNSGMPYLPVYGSTNMGTTAFHSGDYLNGTAYYAMAAFEMFTLGAGTEVTGLIKAGSNTIKVGASAAEKAIVIGEGMYRVKPAAKSVGAKWYQAWSKNFPKGGLMTETELNAAKSRNARWLNSKINQGYTIYDIGPKGTNITSPFYQLERDIIQETGYTTIPLIGF